MNKNRPKLSLKDQIMFFKQLGLLLQGGISLIDSLQTIQHNTKRKRILSVIQRLTQETEQGKPLSQALQAFSKTFSPIAVNLIAIGELSGTLAPSLLSAASELQQNQAIKKKIIAALIYPTIVVVATGGIISLLLLYVFPKVLPVFASVHAELPLTTRLLIQSNTLITAHIWYLAIILTLLSIGGYLIFTTKRFKKTKDQWLLALPFVGQVAKHYILAHFCRTLGHLLNKQVPVTKAMIITANTTNHTIYRQRIIALSLAINHGQSMAQFLENEKTLFPTTIQQLISVGEKTGTLSDNLIFLGQLYEEKIQDTMNSISVLLEPLMMIVIGGLVGFVAISIITPIYQITQNLHG